MRGMWFDALGFGLILTGLGVAMAGAACSAQDRATLARTALDSADRGCRAYLELRREPDAGADASP